MSPQKDFPPIRCCIFDVDGLLIDSEDAYTAVTNQILAEHNRPLLPWSIKAQLQGRPGPQAGLIFHNWAQLPISHDEYMTRQTELQAEAFKHCKLLPGVQRLVERLKERGVYMAVGTSSIRRNYEIKTKPLQGLFGLFEEEFVVVGDDERVPKGRGKPLPDIYLVALETVNAGIRKSGIKGEREVKPEECIVFEDSVPGLEAGRRAGMRAVWVPHPGLLNEYRGREREVLAGLTGEHDESNLALKGVGAIEGSPGKVGELDDGWAEQLGTLEEFDFDQYLGKISR